MIPRHRLVRFADVARKLASSARAASSVAIAFAAAWLAMDPSLPASTAEPGARGLPPILFVARLPIPGHALDAVPGLGPRQRAIATGGRLMLRLPDGAVKLFLHGRQPFDVSDPSVSFDGRRVAFAATSRPDSAWRIWVADADGRHAHPITGARRALDLSRFGDAAARFQRYDDLDPCWLPDGRVCFASTRFPMEAQGGGPATNLFVVNDRGSGMIRITLERNGAEEPTIDPRTGRIVYARWWSNRYLASDLDSTGVTMDRARALPAERVDLWQAVTIRPDGDGIKLAGGNPRRRSETMAYQPCVLADGTLVGVAADSLSLSPAPGRLRLVVYPGGVSEPQRAIEAGPATCSPAALPDGRLVVSRAGRADFGLWVQRPDGSEAERLVDLPGTHELDAAILQSRPAPPTLGAGLGGLPRMLPVTTREELDDQRVMVRFDCLNVFANAPVDAPIPDAPPVTRDVRIRFFAALVDPHAPGGDRLVHVRDGEVTRSGAVHEDVTPADVPMFEQLLDAHGHVLRGTSGPTHVAGFNAGRFGSGTHCVGCHVGHTVIPVAENYAAGKRFNVSPSATVSATSEAAGSRARAAVDRRTRGPLAQVAWIAASDRNERITLRFPFALAIDSLRIYGVRPDSGAGTDLRLEGCDVTLSNRGRALSHLVLAGPVEPSGSDLACGGVVADEIQVRPRRGSGRVLGREVVALAEVETRARVVEE